MAAVPTSGTTNPMAVVPVVEPRTLMLPHRIRAVTPAAAIRVGAAVVVRAATQAVVILPQRVEVVRAATRAVVTLPQGVEVIRAAAHPVLRRTTVAAAHRISRKVIAERCQL